MINRLHFLKNIMILLPLTLIFYQWALGSESGFAAGQGARGEKAAGVTTRGAADNLLHELSGIVPSGWRLWESPKRFTPENLWDKINGGAEFFISYDMVQMTFAEYSDSSNAKDVLSVFIYDMGKPANAFGVFAAERLDKIIPVDLGRRAYGSEAHFFIWKGRYYVRMIASKDSEALWQTNLQIAKRIVDFLDDSGEPLKGLEALPRADRIPVSEQYFRRDAMGLEFMEDTYTARYLKKGRTVSFFLSLKKDHVEAGNLLDRYMTYAKNFGESARKVSHRGVTVALCDMDGTYDALFQKGNIIAGVTSIDDGDFALEAALDLWQELP